MVLPNLDISKKVKLAFSKDAETDQLGLPVLLSVAGVVIVFFLAAATGLEHWLDSTSGPMKVETAVTIPEGENRDAFAGLSNQINALHSKIEKLEMDYERVNAANKSLSVRLQQLETELGPYTASISPRQPMPLNQSVAGTAKRDNLSTHFKAAATQPSPSPSGVTSDPDVVTTVRVGRRSTQTLFALKLPSFRSVRELSSGWRNIRNRSGNTLTGLEPRSFATRDQNARTIYQLLAGPIRNAADAAVRCARLNEIGVNCETTLFAGERVTSLTAN